MKTGLIPSQKFLGTEQRKDIWKRKEELSLPNQEDEEGWQIYKSKNTKKHNAVVTERVAQPEDNIVRVIYGETWAACRNLGVALTPFNKKNSVIINDQAVNPTSSPQSAKNVKNGNNLTPPLDILNGVSRSSNILVASVGRQQVKLKSVLDLSSEKQPLDLIASNTSQPYINLERENALETPNLSHQPLIASSGRIQSGCTHNLIEDITPGPPQFCIKDGGGIVPNKIRVASGKKEVLLKDGIIKPRQGGTTQVVDKEFSSGEKSSEPNLITSKSQIISPEPVFGQDSISNLCPKESDLNLKVSQSGPDQPHVMGLSLDGIQLLQITLDPVSGFNTPAPSLVGLKNKIGENVTSSGPDLGIEKIRPAKEPITTPINVEDLSRFVSSQEKEVIPSFNLLHIKNPLFSSLKDNGIHLKLVQKNSLSNFLSYSGPSLKENSHGDLTWEFILKQLVVLLKKSGVDISWKMQKGLEIFFDKARYEVLPIEINHELTKNSLAVEYSSFVPIKEVLGPCNLNQEDSPPSTQSQFQPSIDLGSSMNVMSVEKRGNLTKQEMFDMYFPKLQCS